MLKSRPESHPGEYTEHTAINIRVNLLMDEDDMPFDERH
tara:strand:+ start:3213 stop:3329 length:117 start_codon:yes stop_codon:yes gene_type:complete